MSGTTPLGAHNEREAALWVRDMFGRVAHRYDLANHLLSFNIDRLWRAHTVRRVSRILERPEARVLDICCGTGDLLLALAAARGPGISQPGKPGISQPSESGFSRPSESGISQASESGISQAGGAGAFACQPPLPTLGSDFCHPMLTAARAKLQRRAVRAPLFEADALRLPLPDASLDLITVAFGFRNLANYGAGLEEMRRVLCPGGMAAVLEFSRPSNPAFAALYGFYSRRILPWIGGALSGSPDAYRYLPESVRKFPSAAELAAHMRRVGFQNVSYELLTGGIVALHLAEK